MDKYNITPIRHDSGASSSKYSSQTTVDLSSIENGNTVGTCARSNSVTVPQQPTNGLQTDGPQQNWISDELAAFCHSCHQPFNLVLCRRHHCRRCGEVFCNDCSNMRMKLPGKFGNAKVRVCDDCALLTTHEVSSQLADELSIRDQMNRMLKLALTEKSKLIESCRSLLLLIDASDLTVSNRRSSQGDSDDEIEFTSRLVTRCESIFRKLLVKLEQSAELQKTLESNIKKLTEEKAVHEEAITLIRSKLTQNQSDMCQLDHIIAERDQLRNVVEEQLRSLEESEVQIKYLQNSYYYRRMEDMKSKSNSFLAPASTSDSSTRIPVCSSTSTAVPVWGLAATTDLQEPLIHIVSDGQQQREKESTKTSCWEKIYFLFCCCRRRRRQQQSPDLKNEVFLSTKSSDFNSKYYSLNNNDDDNDSSILTTKIL